MPLIQNGPITIHYEEAGEGFPLLVLPGGGLNSTIKGLADHAFNPLEAFSDAYRVIALDIRNANGGQKKSDPHHNMDRVTWTRKRQEFE